jgi:hypothetical protein
LQICDSKKTEEKIKKVKIFLLYEKNIFLKKISKTSKKSLFANKKNDFFKKSEKPAKPCV